MWTRYLLLLGVVRLGTCAQPQVPFLPTDFQMNVLFTSYFDKNVNTFTVAYTRANGEVGNRLYIAKTLLGVKEIKIYDFDNDLLYQASESTRQCKRTQGIPEAEKEDQYFPVAFRVGPGGKKVFDQPNSLIRFPSDARKLEKSGTDANEWKAEIKVKIAGKVEDCGLVSVWTANGTKSPLCDRKNENGDVCPPVPVDARADCDGNEINYMFSDYTEYLDYTIFEEPVGFFCEGIERTVLPKLPSVVTFSAETTTDADNDVHRTKVWYDYGNLVYARENYLDAVDASIERTVFDYTTGMKYLIYPDTGVCEPQVMDSKEMVVPEVETVLWGAERKLAYQRSGTRPCRLWDCTVYAGMDTSSGKPDKALVVNVYYAYGEDDTKEAARPVYMELYDEAKTGAVVESRHIFGFRSNFTEWPYDITRCVHQHEVKVVTLRVEGNANFGKGVGTRPAFLQAFRQRLITVMGIAQTLRLSRIYATRRDDRNLLVTALLLPAAKTDKTTVNDISIDEAIVKLNETIKSGQFEVSVQTGNGGQTSVYNVKGLAPVMAYGAAPSAQGYSSGSMAALGIMMLLIGAAIAVGVVVLVSRRYPRSNVTTILLKNQE